jgi:hypothetical protein
MKYLIIENNRAFYQLNGDESTRKTIDQISKEDLLKLVELCMEEDAFEMDPFNPEDIPQAAHQIIYKNIYQKLNDLLLRRVSFSDEKTALYRKAIDSYTAEIEEQ